MARPNSPDMPPKRTKKVRLGIYTRPKQLPFANLEFASTESDAEKSDSAVVSAGLVLQFGPFSTNLLRTIVYHKARLVSISQ